MTSRAETTYFVDAATVYAEGVLAGLRTAANIIGRFDQADIPSELHTQVRAWRAHVYHNAWLAQQGRPAVVPDFPDREELLSRIHAFIGLFPGACDGP